MILESRKGELAQNCPNIQSKWSIQVPTQKKPANMDSLLCRRTILTMRCLVLYAEVLNSDSTANLESCVANQTVIHIFKK